MNISSSIPTVTSNDPHSNASPAEIAERQRVVQAIRLVDRAQIFGANRELTFALDRNTHRPVIRVIDRDTREVVTQLPPEYIMRLSGSLKQNGP